MTNELETKLISWLETSAQAINDFTSKEVPPFIHEYLQWKFLECLFAPCTSLLLGIIFGIVAKLFWKIHDKTREETHFGIACLSTIFSICGVFVCFITCMTDVPTAIQIKVAPKVYLMDKAIQSIKK